MRRTRTAPVKEPLSVGGPRLTAADLGYAPRPSATPPEQVDDVEPLFDSDDVLTIIRYGAVAIIIAAAAFSAGALAGLIHLGYRITSGG